MKRFERETQKEVIFGIILIIVVFLVCTSVISQESGTVLNIGNTPPYLFQNIPNFSWPVDENLVNAFNLDDYIKDDDSLNLNFSYSSVSDIVVIIDLNNNVSFYPVGGFSGIRNITFYATDGEHNVTSNMVFLFVGIDFEPPLWNNPGINNKTVDQNDVRNFTMDWTDNFQLKNYSFFINQGGGNIYYEGGSFTGTSNQSIYSMQISASPGSRVYWGFCAWDTSHNKNCSESQQINVTSLPPVYVPPPGSVPSSVFTPFRGVLGGLRGVFRSGETRATTKNFTVDPAYFKVSLKQGTTETRLLKIINLGNVDVILDIKSEGLDDFIKFSDTSVNLSFGETEKVTVDFSALPETIPDQYVGRIIVNSSEKRNIPVVIDVRPLEFDFDIDVEILEEYKLVKPGSPVIANITIKSLKDPLPTGVNVYFALKDLEGNIYDSLEESIILDDVIYLEKELNVPDGALEGEYIFYGRLSHESGSTIDSDLFEVGWRFKFAAFLRSSLIFIIISLLSLFAIILMLKYRREKEKERILSLYLLLNELKGFIGKGEYEKAIDLYVRIKYLYGEKVSKSALENRDKLKEEIQSLSDRLKSQVEIIEKKKKIEGNEINKGKGSLSTVKPAGELKPATVKPGEIKPATVKLGEIKSATVKPGEIKSATVKPAGEAKPATVKPAGETKSATVKPAGEAKPATVKPAGEAKPAAVKPAGEAKPATVKPAGETKSATVKPAGEAKPATVKPAGETKSATVKPAAAKPAAAKPVDKEAKTSENKLEKKENEK